MRRLGSIGIAVAMAALLSGCSNEAPTNSNAWLSKKYAANCGAYAECTALSDDTEAFNYYAALGITNPAEYTFDVWKAQYGFTDATPEAHAIYANVGDLRMGRNMNCVQSGGNTACYVTNYITQGDPPPVDDLEKALDNTIDNVESIGSVAMVYAPSATQNKVSFYVFNRDGNLLPKVALDDEGEKNVPRMCMACHGGIYDVNTHSATEAAFLPFDVFYFQYSTRAGYKLEDQQEGMRKLNALVAATNPRAPIVDMINGMYPAGVGNAGSLPVEDWVPSGWASNPTLYNSVVKQYCRMCHVAQPISFDSIDFFEGGAGLVNTAVCEKHDMPHAQVPFGKANKKSGFWWDAAAQRDLGTFLKGLEIETCLPSH